ncbi:MAG: DUF975 family protein [Treponema sp.]|nr:DUF975 family protein [Treponema sp.]
MDYTTVQSNRELRAEARRQLKGVWGKMALAYLVFLLINASLLFVFQRVPESSLPVWLGASSLLDLAFRLWGPQYNPALYMLTNVAYSILAGVFFLGFAGYFLHRVRGKEIALGQIFHGFKRFLPCVAMTFISAVFIILWALLLIVPGILKSIGYSMAYYVMHDNPGIKPHQALRKSDVMMYGHRWRFVKLWISFIGWFLLTLPTFGIGILWLQPYIQLSIANFYENIKAIQAENEAQTQALTEE